MYRLEEQDGAIGKALFRAALYCYRCYDSLVLRRASKPDHASEKFLMRDYRVLYVGVPKVATRSLLAALQSMPSSDKTARLIVELDIGRLLHRYPEARDYFKFTFVRNPWSRAASCYLEKIKNEHPIKHARVLHNRRGLSAGMSFESFAEWLNSADGADDVADRHWMSQHSILALDQPGVISYDFIGRFESLEQDYQRLRELSHLALPHLSHRLKTQAPDEYRTLYTDRSIDLIAMRYARDIQLFRYNFDTGF